MAFEKLRQSVTVDGAEYPIETDFRVWIDFEKALSEIKYKSDAEKATEIIKLLMLMFEGKVPSDIKGAMQALTDFYAEVDKEHATSAHKRGELFDYEYDAPYIFAAFKEHYGVDLQEVEYLHWHKFRAMLKSLPSTARIIEIIGYRGIEIDSKMLPCQRKFYMDMKETYKIPAKQAEKDYYDKLYEALENGGDIDAIIGGGNNG